ncbi:hypothetical protein HYW41_00260 [Candidatus Daviesbacteria bacterium]|nr:hypothetical protein [Candidatus Daviesbacteria bacterium]
MTSREVYAQEYIVKPGLFILADHKNDFSDKEIERFKPQIIQALKDVQQFYAKRLNGATFKIYLDVDVKIAQKGSARTGAKQACDVFTRADGFDYFKKQANIIYAIWVIGSKSLNNCAWIYEWDIPYAILDEDNLLKLNSDYAKSYSLGTIAHELGHAFGLVNSEYAYFHPCSIASLKECKPNAPQPLPPAIEHYNDMMSWDGSGAALFPNANINNSIVNPEVSKLLKNPFIISPQSRAFSQVIPTSSVVNSIISRISPAAIDPGQQVIIEGKGFGKEPGAIKLYNSILVEDLTKFDIVQWSDSSITIKIRDEATKEFTTYWDLTIQTKNDPSRSVHSPNLLGINGKVKPIINKSKSINVTLETIDTSKPISITVKALVTCNPDQIPVPNLPVRVEREDDTKEVVAKATTNNQGEALLKFSSSGYDSAVVDPIGNIRPNGGRRRLLLFNNSRDGIYSVFFNYPQCPGHLINPTLTPTPTSTTSEEPNDLTSSQDNDLQQVLISNDADFVDRQDAKGEEITTTEVINNPEQTEEIYYSPPENGNDDITYIRVVEKDGDVKDYSADLNNGETTEVGGIKIIAKIAKKVKEVDLVPVGDEGNKIILYTDEGGYQNPEIELRNDLNLFKIIIIYNDETSEEDSSFYIEKSRPDEQPAEEVPIPPETACWINGDPNDREGSDAVCSQNHEGATRCDQYDVGPWGDGCVQ